MTVGDNHVDGKQHPEQPRDRIVHRHGPHPPKENGDELDARRVHDCALDDQRDHYRGDGTGNPKGNAQLLPKCQEAFSSFQWLKLIIP